MNCSPTLDSETILAELPGNSDTERVLLVHKIQGPHRQTEMELRQQSWAPGIGWFTQSSVHLTPQQMGALRMTMGHAGPSKPPSSVRFPSRNQTTRRETERQSAEQTSIPFVPRVVHAETA